MSTGGERLYTEACDQIGALLDLLGAVADPARLREPCPGRERLGDGSIAAVCAHVADIYGRIAGFAATGRADNPGGHAHAPALDLAALTERLTAAQDAVSVLRGLDEGALNAVPEAGAFRFADGQRTLEQVLAGLLRHQRHQIDAVRRALLSG